MKCKTNKQNKSLQLKKKNIFQKPLSSLTTTGMFCDKRLTYKSSTVMRISSNRKTLVQYSEDHKPQLVLFCEAIVSGIYSRLIQTKILRILYHRCSISLFCVDPIRLIVKSFLCCQHSGTKHRSRICFLCVDVIQSNLFWSPWGYLSVAGVNQLLICSTRWTDFHFSF